MPHCRGATDTAHAALGFLSHTSRLLLYPHVQDQDEQPREGGGEMKVEDADA